MRHFSLVGRADRKVCGLALASLVGFAASAQAGVVSDTIFTLQDGNAVTKFDPSSQDGEFSFKVNGTEELSKQWFWLRLGSSTSGEQSIDSLPLIKEQETGTNILDLDYQNGLIDINVSYLLTGGVGNSAASLAETIKITNRSTDVALPIHFFEYDNFTLDNSTTGNVASISNGNTADQTGPKGTTAEVTASPTPDHFDVGLNGTILGELNDTSPTTLSDNAGPTAAGDAEFAFEWDPTIAKDFGTFTISKLKTITPASAVPVPAAAWTGLVTLGGLAAVKMIRRPRTA